jgi:hypothetical protein
LGFVAVNRLSAVQISRYSGDEASMDLASRVWAGSSTMSAAARASAVISFRRSSNFCLDESQ